VSLSGLEQRFLAFNMFVFVIINGSNMYKHMGKVVIKILQGSAATQTMLGGLTIYLLVANFL